MQEASFLREQPLNEAIALMGGGQVNNPSFINVAQTGVSPTDVVGAQGLSVSAANNAYNAQVA
jgi:hypothetical protein